MDLHDRGAVLKLEVDRDVACLGYTIVADVPTATTQRHRHGRRLQPDARLLRRQLEPDRVMLPRQAPVDSWPWRRFFVPRFASAPRSAHDLPAQWLGGVTARGQPHAAPLPAEGGRAAAVPAGQEPGRRGPAHGASHLSNPPCSASRVASLLGMHERTLNRRLRADGTNFRRVRDEVLYSASQQMLHTTSMRLAEVAMALGYAEPSAFIHAFTRWSGQTPDRWRRGHVRTAAERQP